VHRLADPEPEVGRRRPVERRTELRNGRDEFLDAFSDLEGRAAGELVAMLVEIALERLAEAPSSSTWSSPRPTVLMYAVAAGAA